MGVMESDAQRVREGRPVVLTNCLTGAGIDAIVDYLERHRRIAA